MSTFQDLTGQQFGYWIVKEYLGHSKWLCKCECGTEKAVRGQSLREGKSVSCGCKKVDILREKGLLVKPRPIKDITGQKFGYLTAIKRLKRDKRGSIWLCVCECGKEKEVSLSDLSSGATKSCGCKIGELRRKNGYRWSRVQDLTNQKFGRLTVKELLPRKYNDPVLWKCECECGNERIVSSDGLKHTGITQCKECQRNSLQKRYPRLVRIYADMKQRCLNPKNDSYARYGGRGINICEEWKNSFESFVTWALDNGYSDDLSIDRINVDGNYEPNNCRWVTMLEQANNTSQNVNITYKGETHTRSEWSRISGINKSTLQNRLNKGWSVEETFETPVSKRNRKHKRIAVET